MRILYFTFGPTLQYNRSTNSCRDVAAKNTRTLFHPLLRLLSASGCLDRLTVHPHDAERQESNNGS